MFPKVSILIPVYNRENYISQCFESVISQDFNDWELICYDNGSTDRTWEIINRYANNDKRIQVFQNSKNLGPIPNWKKCLTKANGEYVHWLWSDDYIAPGFYRHMLERMKEKSAQMVMSAARYISNETNYRPIIGSHPIKSEDGLDFAKELLSGKENIPVTPICYLILKRMVLKHFYDNIPIYGKWNCNKMGAGCDLLMIAGAAIESQTIAFVEDPMVYLRTHDGSISCQTNLANYYTIARIWFADKNDIVFNTKQKVMIIYKALKTKHLLTILKAAKQIMQIAK